MHNEDHRVRAGVLFSAGIDSTVQIESLIRAGYNVWPITFDDESSMTRLKRDPALEFWLSRWNLHHQHINIRYMRREELRQPSGYVPGWKLTMITNALAYCEARQLEELHLGYLADDRYPYPDESPDNMQRVVDLYNSVYGTKIKLQLSLRDMTKVDLIQQAHAWKLPLGKTFSCRDVTVAGITHCGRCDICRLRHTAFVRARLVDPSYYISRPTPIQRGERLDKHHTGPVPVA